MNFYSTTSGRESTPPMLGFVDTRFIDLFSSVFILFGTDLNLLDLISNHWEHRQIKSII